MTAFVACIFSPWVVLLSYVALVKWLSPARVSPAQFYGGQIDDGVPPSVFLLVASATISWLFANSITNAASLGAVRASYAIAGDSPGSTLKLTEPWLWNRNLSQAAHSISRLHNRVAIDGLRTVLRQDINLASLLARTK